MTNQIVIKPEFKDNRTVFFMPQNEAAERLAQIAGTKTLTLWALRATEKVGLKLAIIHMVQIIPTTYEDLEKEYGYMGWTNYETWSVNREYIEGKDGYHCEPGQSPMTAMDLGETLKKNFQGALEKDYTDTFTSAVNWSEIAENLPQLYAPTPVEKEIKVFRVEEYIRKFLKGEYRKLYSEGLAKDLVYANWYDDGTWNGKEGEFRGELSGHYTKDGKPLLITIPREEP